MQQISKAEAIRVLDGTRTAMVYKHRNTQARELLKHFTQTDHEFIMDGWKWDALDSVPVRRCTKRGNILLFNDGIRTSELRLYGTKDDIVCWRAHTHSHDVVIVDGSWYVCYYILV